MLKIRLMLTLFGLLFLFLLLVGALYIQFFHHDEPCPLCLLQRVGLTLVVLGLLLNVLYGEKTSHWGLVILSDVSGLAVSIRQICLHIMSPIGFAEPILGIHLYTWCFIVFSVILVGSANPMGLMI